MRSKSSLYNSAVRLAASILTNILGLYLNNLLLTKFGSDVNGVVATIGQILSLITLFEGGFMLASNISLYKPYLDRDFEYMNRVMTATKILYARVGYIALALTLLAAFLAPKLMRTNLSGQFITILFLAVSISIPANFFYYYKYTVLFTVSQQEYRLALYSVSFTILSQLCAILAFNLSADIIEIKVIASAIPLVSIPIVIREHHRRFPYIDFQSENPDFSILKPSKDVLVQRINSLILSSTDAVLLSTFVSTMSTSVYAVYNMIFFFLKNLLFSITLAPFNAFGQLLVDTEYRDRLWENYKIYLHISIMAISIVLSSALIVILPFISLYTRNIHDTIYLNYGIAVLFAISTFLELLTNMTGGLLNSAGKFKEMKSNILLGAMINAVISVVLVGRYGIVGVLLGTVISYLVMDILQIRLVFSLIIGAGVKHLLHLILVHAGTCALILIISRSLMEISFSNYYSFFFGGVTAFASITMIFVFMNYLVYGKELGMIFSFIKRIVCKTKDSSSADSVE